MKFRKIQRTHALLWLMTRINSFNTSFCLHSLIILQSRSCLGIETATHHTRKNSKNSGRSISCLYTVKYLSSLFASCQNYCEKNKTKTNKKHIFNIAIFFHWNIAIHVAMSNLRTLALPFPNNKSVLCNSYDAIWIKKKLKKIKF